MSKPTPEEFFGEKAARAWRTVINAAQIFASATDCLPGDDVFAWHLVKSEEYWKACEDARKKETEP